MLYVQAAVERAMKIQEVICRALAGTLTWLQAADILGIHPRSLRRWRARYEAGGILALYDRRHRRPSRRKAPVAEVQRLLRLYRERYLRFNVRHFYQLPDGSMGSPSPTASSSSRSKKPGSSAKAAPVGGTVAGGSRGPASGSCCTWTAAPMPGWPWCPRSGRP